MTEEKSTKLTHDPKLTVVGKQTPEAKISWLITENPRSPTKATFARFAKYFGAGTVGDYMAQGGTKGDLLWDLRSGFLTVEGLSLGPASEKPARVPRAKKGVAPQASAAEDAQAAVATETIE